MSSKSDTNGKWTSSEKHRDAWDRIWGTKSPADDTKCDHEVAETRVHGVTFHLCEKCGSVLDISSRPSSGHPGAGQETDET